MVLNFELTNEISFVDNENICFFFLYNLVGCRSELLKKNPFYELWLHIAALSHHSNGSIALNSFDLDYKRIPIALCTYKIISRKAPIMIELSFAVYWRWP
jgi:restriction endonuclease S subunit